MRTQKFLLSTQYVSREHAKVIQAMQNILYYMFHTVRVFMQHEACTNNVRTVITF